MILSKEVEITITTNNAKYYADKGYDIPKRRASKRTYNATGQEYIYDYGNKIMVNVEDLPANSHVKILVKCDICGEEKLLSYCDYTKSIKKQNIYTCTKCSRIKVEKTNFQRYGVATPSKNPKIINKIKQTNIQKYGVDNPSKSPDIINKIQNTMFERYGVYNAAQYQEFEEKRKNTMLEKYGEISPMMVPEIKKKQQKTNLERYGCINPFGNIDIRNKAQNTIIEKYGVDNISKLDEIKQKKRETTRLHYGVDNSMQSTEVREKAKNTNLQKYGVEYITQSPLIQDMIKEHNMEKYGVSNPMQVPEIQAKAKETMYKNNTCPTSTQQKYLHNLYGGELNYPIKTYNCDIAFPEELSYIEYNGGGHWLSVDFNTITEKQFIQNDIIRSQQIKKLGYKRIEIISRKDNLPSDSVLLSMLDYARTFFKENPERSWISFDIDNSCIYNAYHKESDDGIPYDFGTLRKIKKTDLPIEDQNQEAKVA